MTNVRETIDSV